jgi:hypothetical protein
MDDAWLNVFNGMVEERPVRTDIHPAGGVKVTTTPLAEISPERVTPDQELIALEIEEKDRAELAKALRAEGFSALAIGQIMREIPRDQI